MPPKYPSAKKAREKRPSKKRGEQASLRKILLNKGKAKKKYHKFLNQTGEEFLEKLELFDDFYDAKDYGVTWQFDKEYLPRPILPD